MAMRRRLVSRNEDTAATNGEYDAFGEGCFRRDDVQLVRNGRDHGLSSEGFQEVTCL